MNEETNQDASKIPPRADHTTALSLFDQTGGMNDFPVLKAFQEYIDAEQARARKRMIGLSAFFVVLLVVVVITFSLIITAVISRDQQNLSAIAARNQQLSDKLLDIALRERSASQQPVVNVQPTIPPLQAQQTSQDSVLKPLIEKIESLASAIASKPQQQFQTTPTVQQSADSPETIRMNDELRRQRETIERIRSEREKIKAEQQQLNQEREKLRQAQVEQHRRRLYPEHYAREDAKKIPPPPPAPTPIVTKPVVEKTVVSKPVVAKPVVQADPVDLKTVKPITYFDEPDADSANVPQKKTGSSKTETLNVNSQEGGTIPFLIELPEKSN